MKTSRILSLLALLAAAGCSSSPPPVAGSGNLAERTRDVRPFTGLAIHNGLVGTVSLGQTALTLKLDDNIMNLVHVDAAAGTLDIGTDNVPIEPSAGTMVLVSSPTVDSVTTSGDSEVTGEANGDDVHFESSGNSRLTLVTTSTSASVESSGESVVTLSGAAQRLRVRASGESTVRSDVPSSEVDIEASGASRVKVRASSRIRVDASGSSVITIVGDPPEKSVELSGDATITYER